jgi:predicted metal-dependent hydrolase
MGFSYPDDFDCRWNPRVPEFAMVANAVSLLMPHAEPYVVSSSREALSKLGDAECDPTDLALRTRAYIRQEAQHHAEHRRFNHVVGRRYRTKLLERMMAATFRVLKRRSSSFGIAFAAGFETVAFVVARWVDARMHTLLPEIGKLGVDGLPIEGGSNVAANLFVWHLAEEAEHRSIAYEVHQRTGGTQLAYSVAMLVSFVILGFFTSLGILMMLLRDRRILHPIAWIRLTGWTLSFLFNAVPLMAVTCLSGYEPADLLDPPNLMSWRRAHDTLHDTQLNQRAVAG